mgnify:CR=1 FL=1
MPIHLKNMIDPEGNLVELRMAEPCGAFYTEQLRTDVVPGRWTTHIYRLFSSNGTPIGTVCATGMHEVPTGDKRPDSRHGPMDQYQFVAFDNAMRKFFKID